MVQLTRKRRINNYMIKYDKLFTLLKENGYTTYKIRKEKILGESVLTKLRNGTGGLDHRTINKMCALFNCQPGDIMEYMPDDDNEKEGDLVK